MSGHLKFTFDGLHLLGWDARAIMRWLQPRPQRPLAEGVHVFLDPCRRAEKEHPGRICFDPECMRYPAGCERDQAGATAVRARGDPRGRIAVVVGKVGVDNPGCHVSLKHIEGLVLWVGMKRWGSAVREQTLPQREPATSLFASKLQALKRAEKPQRLTGGGDNRSPWRCRHAHALEAVSRGVAPIPIQISPSAPARI